MAKPAKLTFATTWINTFTKPCSGPPARLKPLSHCDDVANGFGAMMKLAGQWAIERKESDATPADWVYKGAKRDKGVAEWHQPPEKADDARPKSGIDTVDLAIIVTHGWVGVDRALDKHNKYTKEMKFANVGFDRAPWCRFCSHKTRFGDGKLKWLIVDACRSLEIDKQKGYTPWILWRQSFHGLHTIFGFNGLTTDSFLVSDRGQKFALKILLDLPLAEAWLDSAFSYLCKDDPVAAAAGRDSKDAFHRLANEKISSSFDNIANKEVKTIMWLRRRRPLQSLFDSIPFPSDM
jgi:hypothetical protein